MMSASVKEDVHKHCRLLGSTTCPSFPFSTYVGIDKTPGDGFRNDIPTIQEVSTTLQMVVSAEEGIVYRNWFRQVAPSDHEHRRIAGQRGIRW